MKFEELTKRVQRVAELRSEVRALEWLWDHHANIEMSHNYHPLDAGSFIKAIRDRADDMPLFMIALAKAAKDEIRRAQLDTIEAIGTEISEVEKPDIHVEQHGGYWYITCGDDRVVKFDSEKEARDNLKEMDTQTLNKEANEL